MKLKPVKFIGHKLGPFEHIELNWDKDSRYTLIVAENGKGKTTLVTAIAACLSLGNENLFPNEHFERFAQDEESFAYLELDLEEEAGYVFRCLPSKVDQNVDELIKKFIDSSDVSNGIRLDADMRAGDARRRPVQVTHSVSKPLMMTDVLIIDGGGASGRSRGPVKIIHSQTLSSLREKWQMGREINALTAAYGVGRDIKLPKIQEHQDLDDNALKNILNPFAPIQSTEIFQWVANQYIYHALALSENKPDEAQAYLDAILRIEQLLDKGLDYPISFQVKRNPFRLEVKQNGTTLSVDQLSDGTRSFLSWPLDYLMRASRVNWANPADSATAPGLILVDEIDSHLHPEWQRRVMPMISQLLPETYIIATTHSPFVVGATDEAQVFQIYQDENDQLSVNSTFDELYGHPADLILQEAFVSSLYEPGLEQKLLRLSELARQIAAGNTPPQVQQEHDDLLQELARVSPWLNSLLALSKIK